MSTPQGRPVKARGVVHKLIASTAKEMAAAVYEGMAYRHNDFYAYWNSQDEFVRKRWQSFIQPARESLAELLHPDKHSLTTEAQREEIHQALLLNAAANPAINSLDMPFDA